MLGLSAQWCDPAPDAPFRYGGAVRPTSLPAATRQALEEAACVVAEEAGLVGLNSVDFLVAADNWHLVDVNPRPGATLDIFRPAVGSLFELHIDACNGRLPPRKPSFGSAAAARVVYAKRAVIRVPELAWPDWTADRQPADTSVEAGAPVCTVTADAETPAEARRLVEQRGNMVLAGLGVG
jgi:predicted ATP-grasp superfamily ATP-dependent carboligase